MKRFINFLLTLWLPIRNDNRWLSKYLLLRIVFFPVTLLVRNVLCCRSCPIKTVIVIMSSHSKISGKIGARRYLGQVIDFSGTSTVTVSLYLMRNTRLSSSSWNLIKIEFFIIYLHLEEVTSSVDWCKGGHQFRSWTIQEVYRSVILHTRGPKLCSLPYYRLYKFSSLKYWRSPVQKFNF